MALADRLARQMVEDDRRVRQIVEQRLQPLVEERQPVLHAGEAPALADRGIERVVARRRAEGLDVVAAEAADRLRRQRDLAHRLQRQTSCAGRWCAASRRRRRGSISSVSPKKSSRSASVGARREKVEDAAAHRELADVAHGRHALEAGILQPRDQRVHVDLVAGPGAGRSAPRSTRPAACAAAARWRWSARRRGAASCRSAIIAASASSRRAAASAPGETRS